MSFSDAAGYAVVIALMWCMGAALPSAFFFISADAIKTRTRKRRLWETAVAGICLPVALGLTTGFRRQYLLVANNLMEGVLARQDVTNFPGPIYHLICCSGALAVFCLAAIWTRPRVDGQTQDDYQEPAIARR